MTHYEVSIQALREDGTRRKILRFVPPTSKSIDTPPQTGKQNNDSRKNGVCRSLTGKERASLQVRLFENGGFLGQDALKMAEDHPWLRGRAPPDYFTDASNRINAVKWLVLLKCKDFEQLPPAKRIDVLVNISSRQMESHHLGGLLRRYYGHSPFEAFLEAGLINESDRHDFMEAKRQQRIKQLQKPPREAASPETSAPASNSP